MKKANVISRLETHYTRGKFQVKGERCFARYFHWWLGQLTIPSDEKYDFYNIDQYLPQLAVDAWETLRTDTGQTETDFRRILEEELLMPMANVIELGEESVLNQFTGTTIITYVLSAIVDGNWIRNNTETYCRAQAAALQGMFDKFARLVFRNGLFELIQAESERGMKGKFGSTELRTWVGAGRIMFTFARPKKKGEEVSVSFVGEEDDPLLLSAGIQSVEATLPTAFLMIEDVIARWPKTKKEQKAIFLGSENVAPLAVHVMRAQAKAEAKRK